MTDCVCERDGALRLKRVNHTKQTNSEKNENHAADGKVKASEMGIRVRGAKNGGLLSVWTPTHDYWKLLWGKAVRMSHP